VYIVRVAFLVIRFGSIFFVRSARTYRQWHLRSTTTTADRTAAMSRRLSRCLKGDQVKTKAMRGCVCRGGRRHLFIYAPEPDGNECTKARFFCIVCRTGFAIRGGSRWPLKYMSGSFFLSCCRSSAHSICFWKRGTLRCFCYETSSRFRTFTLRSSPPSFDTSSLEVSLLYS